MSNKKICVEEYEIKRALTEIAVLFSSNSQQFGGHAVYIEEKVYTALCMLKRADRGIKVYEYLPLDLNRRNFSDSILAPDKEAK